MPRLLISALAILATTSALAAATPDNALKYRRAIMDAMKGHTSAVALLAFNQVPDDAGNLKVHAEALADLSKELQFIFPKGSNVEDSEALDAIWGKPDEFAAAVQSNVDAAQALEDAVGSGDAKAIAGAFQDFGKSCKGCHESFRKD